MKITDERKAESMVTINGGDIPYGTIFRGTIGGVSLLLLKVYGQIINLYASVHTWSPADNEWCTIYDYQPLDAELIIHGPLPSE